MAGGFPLKNNETDIRSTEALYQACRFPNHPEVQKEIINATSPLVAKWIAKKYVSSCGRKDWDHVREGIMLWCLRNKLLQHFELFGGILESTGDKQIVEQSRRDTFWGAIPVDAHNLKGRNKLGRMLMVLRTEYRKNTSIHVLPPKIPNMRLLGTDMSKKSYE